MEIVAARYFMDERHEQHIVVVGQIGLFEDRGELELVGGNLVVAGLGGYAEAVAFDFEVKHEGFYARGNGSEIVVVELLVLGAFVAHQGTPGHDEVGASRIEGFVDEEIFLFPAQIAVDMFYVGIEVVCYGCGGFVNGREGAEQGSLVVE